VEEYNKLEQLKENIKKMGSLVIAFSGGVDSSFLTKVAYDVLGNKVLCVTAKSSTFPKRELKEAIEFAKSFNIAHRIIESEELQIEGFADNSINRCYLCKKELFSKIKQLAINEGYNFVAEGSNLDDLGDYRPGLKAIEELAIISPLKDAYLTKDEIRFLSKEMGLKTYNKPSFACLSSRFPYGEKITKKKLDMIDKAEQYLLDLGFLQIRVRHHNNIARIEIYQEEFEKLIRKDIRNKVCNKFKELGFTYTVMDLDGYRTGSMNEEIIEIEAIAVK